MTDNNLKGQWLGPVNPEVVLLPRDPEVGYVYWQWPGQTGRGEVVIFVDAGEDGEREVTRFEVCCESGERFFDFGGANRTHRAVLQNNTDMLHSLSIMSPRREPGGESPGFVEVVVSDQGLVVEPSPHDHLIHGRFPASSYKPPRTSSAPGSSGIYKSNDRQSRR